MFNRVLVAIDGSKQSEKALLTAISDLLSKDSDLHVIHVKNKLVYGAIEGEACYGGVESPHEICRNLLEKDKEEVSGCLEKTCGKNGIKYTFHVRSGDPRNVIIDVAEEIGADIIVLGSTGKGFGERIILGSVSTYVVVHSSITTMVVR
ncbi:universal stress protein [Methanoplanus sp. FWC-SCC4]|uniref:Universal stress protein n=1 Tax=Methanochimaera problematica TaxID=2609417 RepID=A0AA97I528_9EURY|nr:universal stress protein [Methanoplanus sp. FWC-SCC4]WOF17011.1 universal stress protein [Methanoplanus sp. FWC-SCC4]